MHTIEDDDKSRPSSLELLKDDCNNDNQPASNSQHNKHKNQIVLSDEIREVPCSCRSWYCKWCMGWMGRKLRDRVCELFGTFKGLRMLSLTVDRERFNCPEAAYLEVGQRRKLGVLMQHLRRAKLLHSPRYFYVLEFQKAGWPHWHLVVDADFIDHSIVDRNWGIGFVWISRGEQFENGVHAGRYVSKYLTKAPRVGFPTWVLQSHRQIRRFGASRGMRLDPRPERFGERKTSGQPDEVLAQQRSRRTIEERVANCGVDSVLLRVTKVVDEAEADQALREGRPWKERTVVEHLGKGGQA
ncbi:MAG: hypothetical protein K8T25_06515 [Planctomycetia bacterium]|nr:hypothetical protein [Planctomycetia bacterium]